MWQLEVIMDYYQILGVSINATQEEISQAYRRLALEYHPDRNLDKPLETAAKFKEATEAFSVLSDFGKRAKYNQTLARSRPKPTKVPKTKDGKIDFNNDPNLGNCHIPPPPTYDIWGRRLTPEERLQWMANAQADIFAARRKPPPTARQLPAKDNFVDAFAKQYLNDDIPQIRR